MEALLYESVHQNTVKCNLCRHRCIIKDGHRGICNVRENHNGTLKTLVFGKVIARNIDPIEKKPLFHFYPGTLSYSIATVGCNFKCLFCQNADIAQMPSDQNGRIIGEQVDSSTIVMDAVEKNCSSISYTYTEPTVYFEYAFNIAKLAHAQGLSNVFVTNGYMSVEALQMIAPYLDGANVDLKSFSEKFYRKNCGAKLTSVLDTLVEMKKMNIWLELTTLLIPGLNDGPGEIKAIADFISRSLGTDTPWHISRFHPTYKLLTHPVTPVASLLKARETGFKAGLKYVYTGNIPGEKGENTICYQCGRLLIDRWGYHIKTNVIQENACPYCNSKIDGVGL